MRYAGFGLYRGRQRRRVHAHLGGQDGPDDVVSIEVGSTPAIGGHSPSPVSGTVNSGTPETLLTVWDVATGASELVRWPGLIYQFVASAP